MKSSINNVLKPFIPQVILEFRKNLMIKKGMREWKKNGCPLPPPNFVKHLTITQYQKKYNCSTLVETGTFMGDMVEAQRMKFKKVISIELSVELFEKARERFKKINNVAIIQGDSGKELPKIIEELDGPAMFWLDGHYSGGITAKGDKESPIFEELNAIFNGKQFNHILIIDDARCFNGEGDYPNVEKLTDYIRSKNDRYQVEVKNDIIRCVI